jgi:hypothetical protein
VDFTERAAHKGNNWRRREARMEQLWASFRTYNTYNANKGMCSGGMKFKFKWSDAARGWNCFETALLLEVLVA